MANNSGDNERCERCERCAEKLNPDKSVWLELSQTTGLYHRPEEFPASETSQGGFAFGAACARAVLKAGGRNDHMSGTRS